MSLLGALVSVAILAILASLAAPSFQRVMQRVKVQTAVDELMATLHFARAEAFKRGGHVAMARAATSGCAAAANQDWSCGWTVFADDDDNGLRGGTEDELRASPATPGVQVIQTSNRAALNVSAWGQFNGAGALSFVVRSSSLPDVAQKICMAAGGRIRKCPVDGE